MDVNTVTYIVNLFCQQHQQIEAIKLFRRETNLDLSSAHRYLRDGAQEGENALFVKMCADFVQTTSDLLLLARVEKQRWTVEVDRLEALLLTELEELASDGT